MSSSDWPLTDDAIRDTFESMLRDGSWGRYHGPHCAALSAAIGKYLQVEHVTLCSSGTAAVELALRAAGVSGGDEVILAAYDYKANFVNVLTLQAVPVLVDTLPGLPVLDPTQLAAALSDRTRAIVCSHLHGSFARMSEIMAVAAERGIPVVEDACQAPGAILNTRRTGSMGDVGVLSFGGSKLLTAGRGGAVVTNNGGFHQRIRLHTQRGNDAYPLSEMQAAVLLPQLQQLDTRNAVRLETVKRLLKLLDEAGLSKDRAKARLQSAVDPDPRETDDLQAFYKLALRYSGDRPGSRTRDEFAAVLRERGVAIDAGFSGLHKIHSRRRFRAIGNLPEATRLHSELLTLHHPILLSPESVCGLAELLSSPDSSLTDLRS